MSDISQRLGKAMIYTAWLLVLGVLTLFFNNFLYTQNNPNQQVTSHQHGDGTREVVLKRNRSGHYVASGAINGMSVDFLLDTGATTVSIPAHVASRLGLKQGTSQLSTTANGTITTYTTEVNSVALGDIELHQVRATINPNMREDEILLGMSFLKQLELIQRGNTLILRQIPRKY